MKLLILIASLFLSATSFATLNTFEYVVGSQYQLVDFQLDEAHQPRGQITRGKLVVSKGLVEMNIQIKKVCPAGKLCTMEMPQPIYAKLPIVEIEKSECGDRIVAAVDSRPVDGQLQQIIIMDYTNATCEIVLENPILVEYTTAGYDRLNGGEWEATSEFGFAPLKFNFPLEK
jgi:hypothetical protein